MSFNIKARILARKIVFCYFFEQYFLALSIFQEGVKEEIEKVHSFIEGRDDDSQIKLSDILTPAYYASSDEEIAYLIQHVFLTDESDDQSQEVDYRYISQMAWLFRTYEPIVRDLVNQHITTFTYNEMDVMDRVIFVLGYIERKEVKTPREVVLNEMIELGKRYGDEASPKLINGIAHKILS